MTLSWPDVSEIVGGLVIAGQIAENAVRPDQFSAPYNEVIKRYKNGTRNVETLIEMFGLSAISPLLEAPKQLPQTQVNWTSLLENACAAYQAGVDLEKLAKKMKQGDPVDLTQLTSIAMKAQSGQSSQLIPASKVEARKAVFMPSGWQPIDEHLGGLPESGLVVVGARPKTGKTWWALTLCYHFLKQYPNKKVAFFSAEMLNDEIRERLDHMDKKAPLSDELLDRFLISDDAFNTETIINRCATVDDLGLVVVDFADMVVKEISEPEYTALYMLLAKLAKQQRIPVILLAQLSGSYQGGLPRPHMLRWCLPKDARIVDGLTGEFFTPETASDHTHVLSLVGKDLVPAEYVIEKNVPQPILKITTWSGNVIRCGDTHPLLCGMEWKPANQLIPGDMVAAVKSHQFSYTTAYSKERARLLGYMLGDGYMPKKGRGQITWCEVDPITIADFEHCIQTEFPDLDISKKFHSGCWYLSPVKKTHSGRATTSFAAWLESMGVRGQNSFTFRVPDEVFGWDNESIAAFLSAIYTADGCVRSSRTIGYHSVSPGLLIDLKHLLTRFGILAMISGNELTIANQFHALRFIQNVGFVGSKQQKGEQLFDYIINESGAARTEQLPLNVSLAIRDVTTKKLPTTRSLTTGRARRLLAHYGHLDDFWQVSKDIWWDTIKTIEPDGFEDTWDVCVPGMENFVVDGFITHNTRLAEALAWMVLMLWNPAKDTFADDPDSDNSLPIIKDHAYCIAWMVRGGYPCHPDDNPGAICIPFKGESWHPSRSKWFSLTKEERAEKRRMNRSKQD